MTEEKTIVEETGEPSATETAVVYNTDKESTERAEVTKVEKAHGDQEPSKEEGEAEEKSNDEQPSKRQRGRPKKTESSEPAAKKPKTEKKGRQAPERVSSRVANQRAGIKLQTTEELPKKKRTPSKKATKSAVDSGATTTEQNGTSVEV